MGGPIKTFVELDPGVHPADAERVLPRWSPASQLAANFLLSGNGEGKVKSLHRLFGKV